MQACFLLKGKRHCLKKLFHYFLKISEKLHVNVQLFASV